MTDLLRRPEVPATATSPVEDALVRVMRERLARAVVKVCPPDLAASVDDIVQLAIMRVLAVLQARASSGEGIEPPPASYLWKVAYTTTIDELRKMQSRERTRDRATGIVMPVEEPRPDAAVAASEVSVALRGCLDALQEDRRRAVVLHLQGHTVPETGGLLGWSRKRAENFVYRGLADLRRCLSKKGFSP